MAYFNSRTTDGLEVGNFDIVYNYNGPMGVNEVETQLPIESTKANGTVGLQLDFDNNTLKLNTNGALEISDTYTKDVKLTTSLFGSGLKISTDFLTGDKTISAQVDGSTLVINGSNKMAGNYVSSDTTLLQVNGNQLAVDGIANKINNAQTSADNAKTAADSAQAAAEAAQATADGAVIDAAAASAAAATAQTTATAAGAAAAAANTAILGLDLIYATDSALSSGLAGKQDVGDYATNTALTTGLATKQNVGDYATNTALTTGLATKQDVGDYATNTTVADGLATKQDVGDYVTTDTMSNYATNIDLTNGLATKQDVGDYATNTALTNGLATKQPTGDYATNTSLTTGLASKQPVNTNLTNLASTITVATDGAVASPNAALTLAGNQVATQNWVTSQNYETSGTASGTYQPLNTNLTNICNKWTVDGNGAMQTIASTDGFIGFRSQNTSATANAFNLFELSTDTAGGHASLFANSSLRTTDGGASSVTLRNEGGDLHLQGKGAKGMTVSKDTGNTVCDGNFTALGALTTNGTINGRQGVNFSTPGSGIILNQTTAGASSMIAAQDSLGNNTYFGIDGDGFTGVDPGATMILPVIGKKLYIWTRNSSVSLPALVFDPATGAGDFHTLPTVGGAPLATQTWVTSQAFQPTNTNLTNISSKWTVDGNGNLTTPGAVIIQQPVAGAAAVFIAQDSSGNNTYFGIDGNGFTAVDPGATMILGSANKKVYVWTRNSSVSLPALVFEPTDGIGDFHALPTVAGAPLATQSWVQSQNYATVSGTNNQLVVVTYPPANMTVNTTTMSGFFAGNGAYVASSNLGSSTAYRGWTASQQCQFGSPDYWTQTGAYIAGSATTTVDGTSYAGDWLQLQLPRSESINQMDITASNDATMSPATFLIAGSNDGSTWTRVYPSSGLGSASGWTAGSTQNFAFGSNFSYLYFRVIVTTIVANPSGGGPNTLSLSCKLKGPTMIASQEWVNSQGSTIAFSIPASTDSANPTYGNFSNTNYGGVITIPTSGKYNVDMTLELYGSSNNNQTFAMMFTNTVNNNTTVSGSYTFSFNISDVNRECRMVWSDAMLAAGTYTFSAYVTNSPAVTAAWSQTSANHSVVISKSM